MFVFFKQKTAYEMRISDWSSDVCSSDLTEEHLVPRARGSTEFEPMIAGDVVGDLRWHRHRELALGGSRRIDATVDMEVLLRHGKLLHPGNHSLLAFSIGGAIAHDRRRDRSADQHQAICKTTHLFPLALLKIGNFQYL